MTNTAMISSGLPVQARYTTTSSWDPCRRHKGQGDRGGEKCPLYDIINHSAAKRFDTVVGEGGETLSGGKSSAFPSPLHFEGSPIVIHDEPPQACTPTTKATPSGHQRPLPGKDAACHAHRLNTIRAAD
jgi:hypothetical protein